MKKLLTLTLFVLASVIAFNGFAQPLAKRTVLDYQTMLSQADSVKTAFEKQGYSLSKSSSMNMESENELPVILSLTEGTNYRIVFISDATSSTSTVSMQDWNEKEVATKTQTKNQSNIISYDYTAKGTEYHMIKPVQTNKSKNQVAGHFMIFKKS